MSKPHFSQRLHIILLGVADIQVSKAFYDSLGWVCSQDSHAGFIKYDLGGIAIALIAEKNIREDINQPAASTPRFRGSALIYLAQSPDHVAQLLDKARTAGGAVVKEATKTPWGIAGYFADPDGHLFEIDFEEKFEFTEDHQLITQ